MKTPFVLIALALLPALALAGGSHSDGLAYDQKAAHGHEAPQADGHTGNAGVPGNLAEVVRSVDLLMDDSMRFVPDSFTIKAGETIRFMVRNNGKLKHEMVIGSMADLKAHAVVMRKFPGMEHEEPNMVTLEPGQQGSLVWKFEQPGVVDFACLIPGHMEAGMTARVIVVQ